MNAMVQSQNGVGTAPRHELVAGIAFVLILAGGYKLRRHLESSAIVTNDLAKAIQGLGGELRAHQRGADDDPTVICTMLYGADTAVFCFAWIGFLGAAFTVPDQCKAQQPPSAGRDVLRMPIVEGRDIRFRRLSDPQKLSEVRVDSIVQDSQGFMWFGTWNGLNRYDGYNALFKDHSGNLWYAERHFNVRVRDDGIGIDASVVSQEGRPGHFGLRGMRERSKSIGGQPEVWSEHGVGTEMELTIPTTIAYGPRVTRRLRLFRIKVRANS
jgi:hypothetical protein